MEGIAPRGETAVAAPIEVRLAGPIRAEMAGGADVLPTLRKARALFVVLAVADGQSATRRWLAGLLWSRNDAAQGLARLRDALSTLRQSLRDQFGDDAVIVATADRVALRPGTVAADFGGGPERSAGLDEIAADLDGIDPALDAWLLGLRGRLRADRAVTPMSLGGVRARRGVVVGLTPLQAIGGSGGGELAFLLSEEMAATLSRIRGVSVVAARSGTVPPEAGCEFTLEGSLQQFGRRLRVAVKLVEEPTGVVCWSHHFDYEHDDVFHIQQEVAALVAAGLEPEIPSLAGERLRRLGMEGDSAFELMLRAISLIHLLDRRSFDEAGELLGRVIATEPEYSPAYSWLALWHVFQVGQGWARDARASIARAGDVAEHAVMLDPNDARGLTVAGHVRAFLHRRLDEAIPLHERALAVNPSLPLAWHLSGVAQAYRGNLDEARRRIEHCRRLAPNDPHSFFADGALVIVELLSRQHEAAAALGRKVTQLHPRFSAAYKPYLSALGHLGEEREAATVLRRLLMLEPDFSLRSFRSSAPFARREHLDYYVSGLSLAGVT